jgi:hypothetical protein
MNELKALLSSIPFRTFPLHDGQSDYQQRVVYDSKFNPLKSKKDSQLETHKHTVAAVTRVERERSRETDNLSQLLIEVLDELSSMYSREWMNDAKQHVKDKLLAFLIEPNVVKALGRKKTCDAIYFFETRPKPDESRIKNLGWILSFLFGKNIYINDKKYTWNAKLGFTQELRFAHHANGRWSIKN